MAPVISLRTVTNNVGWSILSKTSTFGLKFVTVPILARLLSPEEFGIVAVAQLVVLFLTMVGGAGLAAALVVERTHDDTTVHSVFWTNFAMAIAMALVVVMSVAWLLHSSRSSGKLYSQETQTVGKPIKLHQRTTDMATPTEPIELTYCKT